MSDKITFLFDGGYQVPGDDGLPLNGGKLHFYVVNSTTPKDTYPTYADALAQTNANANPVVLDAYGRAAVWIRGPIKIVRTTSADVAVGSPIDYFNSADVAVVADAQDATNLVQDGSIESWAGGSPSACTVTPYGTGATLAVASQETADSEHGGSALKVVAAGAGGATFVWGTFFPVSPLMIFMANFMLKSSAVNVKNIIKVNWYDKDQTQLGGGDAYTTIYSEAAANAVAWTRFSCKVAPPATARFAKVAGVLSDPSGTTLNGTVRIDGISVAPDSVDFTPAGALQPYAGSTAPAGWLLCYGQAVSRTTYARLFEAISTTYGVGDGSTTFNIPDLRGRIPVGLDAMGGAAASRLTSAKGHTTTLGSAAGAETHALVHSDVAREIPRHAHVLPNVQGDVNYQPAIGNPATDGAALTRILGYSGTPAAFTGANIWRRITNDSSTPDQELSGAADGHENVQPYLAVNYIVKW